MIWHPCSFPRFPVLKLVFLYIWTGYLRESLYWRKVRQAACLAWWGTWDCTRSNTGESGIICIWFGLHPTISHSFGDISVIVRLFLGILWISIKQIKAPYVFDREHGIDGHATHGNCASSLTDGEVSWIFSSCGRKLRYIHELWQGCPFNTHASSATSALLSSYDA